MNTEQFNFHGIVFVPGDLLRYHFNDDVATWFSACLLLNQIMVILR